MDKKHDCGDGFKGVMVKTHGIAFCQLCGYEKRRQDMVSFLDIFFLGMFAIIAGLANSFGGSICRTFVDPWLEKRKRRADKALKKLNGNDH